MEGSSTVREHQRLGPGGRTFAVEQPQPDVNRAAEKTGRDQRDDGERRRPKRMCYDKTVRMCVTGD